MSDPDSDASGLELAVVDLERELRDLDVAISDQGQTTVPAGARGVDPIIIGSIVITAARSPELLRALLSVLQSWIDERSKRTVDISSGDQKLHLSGLKRTQQQQLIDDWLSRQIVEKDRDST